MQAGGEFGAAVHEGAVVAEVAGAAGCVLRRLGGDDAAGDVRAAVRVEVLEERERGQVDVRSLGDRVEDGARGDEAGFGAAGGGLLVGVVQTGRVRAEEAGDAGARGEEVGDEGRAVEARHPWAEEEFVAAAGGEFGDEGGDVLAFQLLVDGEYVVGVGGTVGVEEGVQVLAACALGGSAGASAGAVSGCHSRPPRARRP